MSGERAPWNDFPQVIRNGDLSALQQEPEYQAAKSGDYVAALNLVDRSMSDETINRIRTLIGDSKPALLPVLATEQNGNNKIPLAMAAVLSKRLDLKVEVGITQREKVYRTGTGADHRLAFSPTFEGQVHPGRSYLILDDTLTMGGTIASLRGYIENRAGKVIGASVMTARQQGVDLAVKPAMLETIARKHGPAMNAFWQETFGYGIDYLTQNEAGHLRAAASVDAIRARIAAARHAGLARMDAGRARAPVSKARADKGPTEGQKLDDRVRAIKTEAKQRAQARRQDAQQQADKPQEPNHQRPGSDPDKEISR